MLGLVWNCWGIISLTMVLSITTSVMVLLFILDRTCIGHFSSVFHDRLRCAPEQFTANGITLDLYQFDSASASHWSADGMVRTQDFISATQDPAPVPPSLPQTQPRPANQWTYRIAMTHHHAVGIPHDHRYENLMILRNSGAFLSELTQQHIRLILHGHKHHQHFTRLTVNAERQEEFEIGVLGAGTVTRGNPSPEPFGYHFYFLELDANLNMQATPYLSRGGAFHAQPSFYIEDIHEAVRRQRTFAGATYGLNTTTLKAITKIVPDGDTIERMEYHGFQVTHPNQRYTQLPRSSQAIVDKGHIEGFIACPLDALCPPALHLRPDPAPTRYNLRTQYGDVCFGSPIYANSPPFSFFTEFQALNSVAMSVQQHEERYGRDSQSRTESTTLTTPVFPVDTLEIIVEFPTGFQISGHPELTIENANSQRLNLIEQEYRQALRYDPASNTIRLTVPAPPPDTSFIIRWGLCHVQPPEARAIASLSGTTKQLQRTLVDLAWGQERTTLKQDQWAIFQLIAQMAEGIVRDLLKVGSLQHDPLEVSLMVYDNQMVDNQPARLRIIGGNYPVTDDRATKALEFGDGLAGKCHRTNSIRLFVKALGDSARLYGYLPWDNYPNPAGIPHEVLLCLPLTNPENAALIYGVLNIASKRADSKLLSLYETSDDHPQLKQDREALYATLNKSCFDELVQTIKDPPLTVTVSTDTVTPEVNP